jgi:hypothetical protein
MDTIVHSWDMNPVLLCYLGAQRWVSMGKKEINVIVY